MGSTCGVLAQSEPVFEFRPLPYAEAGYGYPESGQTVINVTGGSR